MVEIELDLVASRVDGLGTSELELLNEVFMGNLGETTTLIGVEVDVINIKRGGTEAGSLVGVAGVSGAPVALASIVELEVNLDLVVL